NASRLDLVCLLGRLAERRGGVVDLDLYLAIRFGLDLFRPRFDHVDLEEAFRSEEMAELQYDLLLAQRYPVRSAKHQNGERGSDQIQQAAAILAANHGSLPAALRARPAMEAGGGRVARAGRPWYCAAKGALIQLATEDRCRSAARGLGRHRRVTMRSG